MKTSLVSSLLLGLAIPAITGCADGTAAESRLYDETEVTADIAQSAGDAMANAVQVMAANEAHAALPGATGGANLTTGSSLTVERTRNCYDASDALVTGCSPIASVRMIVTHVSIDGSRSGSRVTADGRTVNWSGAVHRVSDDTLTRNFAGDPPAEVSRTHSDLTVGHDTTMFSDGEMSRHFSEATVDSIQAVTWNVPRASNPFPVSGTIVRVATIHAVFTKGDRTESRDLTVTIRVSFPADAQGNVVLEVNDKTCNLNLVTRVVSNCS